MLLPGVVEECARGSRGRCGLGQLQVCKGEVPPTNGVKGVFELVGVV